MHQWYSDQKTHNTIFIQIYRIFFLYSHTDCTQRFVYHNHDWNELEVITFNPDQNVVWYNNSWLGFLKILNYVPKEREKFSAKNEPPFVR